jgi:Flp pilus assembly protein TadD
LGTALAQSGKLPEAVSEFQTALRINPGDAEAHNNLGAVLLQMRRTQEAIAEFQAALRIRPDYAVAKKNLQDAMGQQ